MSYKNEENKSYEGIVERKRNIFVLPSGVTRKRCSEKWFASLKRG